MTTPTTDPAVSAAKLLIEYANKDDEAPLGRFSTDQVEIVNIIRAAYRNREAAAQELMESLDTHIDYVLQSKDDCEKCKRIYDALARLRALTPDSPAPGRTDNTIADG